jgi:C4-dicarboxylate-specific signal transduction histidine kinase
MGKPETMTFRAVDTDPGPLLALGSLLPSLPDTPKIDGAGGQETFKQLRGEIAHAARLSILGELTASIAHEVIQPLTAIGSNIEAMQLWLERLPLNLVEVRELTARTAIEVQRAADIIHRVRAMAVRSAPEQLRMAVNPVIEEAMLFLRHELHQNSVGVSLHLEDHLPAIHGDRVQLQQVIVNLTINAIQAMNNTEVTARRLLISTSLTADNCVYITFEDTGPGIASESRDRVFESFFSTKSGGMGIGLPICRTIIEAHRGRIDVVNRPGAGGALINILLPSCLSILSPASELGAL